ncbi:MULTISPECIES: CHAT domain-containing protein [unclassified Streptomyces]|uniref:CHAT domain-containing protein n=1 Tax=unclassified Streptomyces TaxID=2593676 RepID=UPI00381C68F6
MEFHAEPVPGGPESAEDADEVLRLRAKIVLLDEMLGELPQWATQRWAALARRGTLWRRLHAVTLDPAGLDAAISDLQAAVEKGRLQPERYKVVHDLANALLQRHEHSLHDIAPVLRAARLLEEAAADAPEGDRAGRAEITNSQASALARYATATGDLGFLDRAIAVQRDAVALAGPDALPRHLCNLSDLLREGFLHRRHRAAADEAMEAARQALALAPPGHPGRHTALLTLAERCLRSDGVRGHARALLDEAAALIREAEGLPVVTAEERAGIQATLSDLRAAQYARDPSHAFLLDRALHHASRAVSLTPAGSLNRSVALRRLAELFTLHGNHTGDRSFAEGIPLLYEGAARDAGPRERFSLHTLSFHDAGAREAAALLAELPPEAQDGGFLAVLRAAALTDFYLRSPADHSKAADQASQLLDQVQDRPELHDLVETLRAALAVRRAKHTHALVDIEAALGLQQPHTERLQAKGLPGADAARDQLAALLELRALAAHPTPGEIALRHALLLKALPLRRAAVGRPAHPARRLARWFSLGFCAGLVEQWEEASHAFGAALELFSGVAAGLEHADRDTLLADSPPDLPANAAAVGMRRGTPRTALEHAESGRALLTGERLGLRDRMPELTALDENLADRLAAVDRRLADLGPPPADLAHPDAVARMTGHRALVAEREEILGGVRTLDPLRRFMLPLSGPELLSVSGPVVVPFCSVFGSYAVVVHAGALTSVPLPYLTADRLTLEINEFDEALRAASSHASTLQERSDAENSLTRMCIFLWKTIVQPVLDYPEVRLLLEDSSLARASDGRPRLWWCPVGRLGLLPLHAAAAHPTARAARPGQRLAALDRVVSSYATSLSALASARTAPPFRPEQGLLTVSLPRTPGRAPLAHTREEADAALAWAADRSTTDLPGERATRDEVLERLRSADWLHYAGHADPPTARSDTAGLVPYDHAARGSIGLGDLVRVGAGQRRWLAYLSACSTARGRPELIDQASHVAGALQAAGYAHVVATQWPVRSDTAAEIAEDFYSALPQGVVRHDDVAFALDHAVRMARQDRLDRPSRWAPYHHRGP